MGALGYVAIGVAILIYFALSAWIVKSLIAAAMSGMLEERHIRVVDLLVLFLLGPLIYGLGFVFFAVAEFVNILGISISRSWRKFFIS